MYISRNRRPGRAHLRLDVPQQRHQLLLELVEYLPQPVLRHAPLELIQATVVGAPKLRARRLRHLALHEHHLKTFHTYTHAHTPRQLSRPPPSRQKQRKKKKKEDFQCYLLVCMAMLSFYYMAVTIILGKL